MKKIWNCLLGWILGFGSVIGAILIIILVGVLIAGVTILGYLIVIFAYILIPVFIIIALAFSIYKYFRG